MKGRPPEISVIVWSPSDPWTGDHVGWTDQFGMAFAGGAWARRAPPVAVKRKRTAVRRRFMANLRKCGSEAILRPADNGIREWRKIILSRSRAASEQ
jgi:hypothetical protein